MALCMSGLCHKGALLCLYRILKTAFQTKTKAPESLRLVTVMTFNKTVLPQKCDFFCDCCPKIFSYAPVFLCD